jgi:uncharacterized protein
VNETRAAPAAITARLGALAGQMRARGARVGVGELLAAHRALAAVDPASPADARLALRATLCASRADLSAFDAAFAACFGTSGPAFEPAPAPLDPVASLVLPRVAVPGRVPLAPGEVAGEVRPAAWSEVELLRERDFADYTEAERRLAQSLVRELARRGPTRRSRRLVPVRRRGQHPDLRATLRASLRHAGEPLERRYRASAERNRRMTMVIDISGSMEPYARMLLQYVQACVTARRRVEAFAFGTRLTRITDELRGRDPDRALARAAAAVADWSGGTRIGASLAELNRAHGRRVGRGAIVAILSDGWDRGDPALLAREVERLRRCAHRLVWLNPLKAQPTYEPLTRGMQAALPHVDAFLAGNSLASLAELARLWDDGFEDGRRR